MILLTPAEVAERLRVSPKTVQRLTRTGELRAIRIGRLPRYTEKALEAYVADKEHVRRRRGVA